MWDVVVLPLPVRGACLKWAGQPYQSGVCLAPAFSPVSSPRCYPHSVDMLTSVAIPCTMALAGVGYLVRVLHAVLCFDLTATPRPDTRGACFQTTGLYKLYTGTGKKPGF